MVQWLRLLSNVGGTGLIPRRTKIPQPVLCSKKKSLIQGKISVSVNVIKWISLVFIYGTLLQYSCLENPMDREAWWAVVHGVAKSRTRLRDFTFTFHFYALEKEMATHSSVLAWRIPGTGEPGGPLSMGSHRVGHD